jgi:hypothetical protein
VGQKTGFFLDQRDNRAFIGRLCTTHTTSAGQTRTLLNPLATSQQVRRSDNIKHMYCIFAWNNNKAPQLILAAVYTGWLCRQ